LRWSLQSGFVPLPKSDNPQRIKENADIFDFELDEQDMISLNSLNQVNDEVKDRPVSWTAQFEGVE
jgi:diketogulonate reductase-like aldo/keto reductase